MAVQKQQLKDNMIDEAVFFDDETGHTDKDTNLTPEKREALRQLW